MTSELLHDPHGRRLYATAAERAAFLAASVGFPRPVRMLCGVLARTGYRVSEALQLTSRWVDLTGRAMISELPPSRGRGR